ncbi:glycosyltransferase family 2 protein [Ornithinimicrobium sp. LYQ92]|uniref:glycosyltransferase family 2 protein n=1 Tax=Serinicoccus sp. LYQ92 TaxID=3378798 RepID=UPI003854DD0A
MGHTPAGTEKVRVSVVVPVYNAMPYLKGLLLSLVDQDLPVDQYEVIAVDDGSTDAGPALLDDAARTHPQLRVVHQENSGWPGIPRNRGLDLARGTYVFFADADDEMGSEALRRMVDFADEHGSDVLVPKMVGRGGRWVRASMYASTQVDADLETVFQTLTPQKMFRRSMLLEHEIRFPEEKVRLEDGMVLAHAYLKARRVSLYADYDCYYLTARDDGGNISGQRFDPEGYTWSIAEVSRIVSENDPDPARAGRIILDLYRRKCLKFYEPARWSRMPPARRTAFVRAHQEFIDRWIPPELEATLEQRSREVSALVRAGDEEGLLASAQARLEEPLSGALLVGGRWVFRGGLELTLEIHGGRVGGTARPLVLEIRRRDGDVVDTVALPDGVPVAQELGRSGVSRRTVVLQSALFRSDDQQVLDLRVFVEGAVERARVAAPLVSVLPAAHRGVRPYVTVQGNLSIEVLPG